MNISKNEILKLIKEAKETQPKSLVKPVVTEAVNTANVATLTNPKAKAFVQALINLAGDAAAMGELSKILNADLKPAAPAAPAAAAPAAAAPAAPAAPAAAPK